MSRFRLFGRADTGNARPGPPPYPRPAEPPPEGAGAPWPARAAAPVRPPTWPSGSPQADPPTDPHGFSAVPAPRRAPAPPAPPPPPAPLPGPHPAEAAALAGAFAVDYLSWDEDDPARRGRVLQDYLPGPTGGDVTRMGWSGRGRQRAEFALPGLVRPDGDGRVLVDVRVRVTPYRAVGEHGPDPASVGSAAPDVAGIPAAAPAPTGRGWRSLASYWIRISVPVASEGGRLIIDAWEETLADEPAPPPAPAPPDDHSLADDDPLTGPPPEADRRDGAW